MKTVNFVLDQSSKIKLYFQLYTKLSEQILSGEIPAGTKLPSVRTLSTQLNVSRNTVTKALDDLQNDGFIVSKNKSGYYAIVPDKKNVPVRNMNGEIELANDENVPAKPAKAKGAVLTVDDILAKASEENTSFVYAQDSFSEVENLISETEESSADNFSPEAPLPAEDESLEEAKVFETPANESDPSIIENDEDSFTNINDVDAQKHTDFNDLETPETYASINTAETSESYADINEVAPEASNEDTSDEFSEEETFIQIHPDSDESKIDNQIPDSQTAAPDFIEDRSYKEEFSPVNESHSEPVSVDSFQAVYETNTASQEEDFIPIHNNNSEQIFECDSLVIEEQFSTPFSDNVSSIEMLPGADDDISEVQTENVEEEVQAEQTAPQDFIEDNSYTVEDLSTASEPSPEPVSVEADDVEADNMAEDSLVSEEKIEAEVQTEVHTEVLPHAVLIESENNFEDSENPIIETYQAIVASSGFADLDEAEINLEFEMSMKASFLYREISSNQINLIFETNLFNLIKKLTSLQIFKQPLNGSQEGEGLEKHGLLHKATIAQINSKLQPIAITCGFGLSSKQDSKITAALKKNNFYVENVEFNQLSAELLDSQKASLLFIKDQSQINEEILNWVSENDNRYIFCLAEDTIKIPSCKIIYLSCMSDYTDNKINTGWALVPEEILNIYTKKFSQEDAGISLIDKCFCSKFISDLSAQNH